MPGKQWDLGTPLAIERENSESEQWGLGRNGQGNLSGGAGV